MTLSSPLEARYDLKTLREGLGWSRADLARRTQCQGRTIERVESGREPHPITARLICEVISNEYALEGKERIRPYQVWPEYFGDPFARAGLVARRSDPPARRPQADGTGEPLAS